MPFNTFREVEVQAPDGKRVRGVEINPIKRFVRSSWLTPAPSLSVEGSEEISAGGSSLFYFKIDTQGHFDWAKVVGFDEISTPTDPNFVAPITLEFMDPVRHINLQNKPIRMSLCSGRADRPFILPKHYFVNIGDGERELTVRARNLDVDQRTVRLALFGRRFYHKEMPPELARDIVAELDDQDLGYSYWLLPNETDQVGSGIPYAGGETVTVAFEADSTFYFEATKLMMYLTVPSFPGQFFRIFEVDTKRTLMTDWIPVDSGFGTGEFPFILEDTYLLEPKKKIVLEFRDESGTPGEFFVALSGRRRDLR